MFDHPSAAELIAAARMHLEQQVIPSVAEPRLRFQTLVAANVLAIAERELAAGTAHLAAAWRRAADLQGETADQPAGEALPAAVATQAQRLCTDIRAGVYDQLHGEQKWRAQQQIQHRDRAKIQQQKQRAMNRIAADQHRSRANDRDNRSDREDDIFHMLSEFRSQESGVRIPSKTAQPAS